LAIIKARTLIVHGDNDFIPLAQALEIHQKIPNARLWIVPNGWHMPHMSGPNAIDFNRRTLEFLSGEWSEER
jgi:pimeloyl-ACP methyl ester carboxylesterase